MELKRQIYNILVEKGLKILSIFFPDIHMSVPLKPSDRFLEYPFAIGRLPEKRVKLLDIGSAGSFFPLIVAALGYDVTACDIRTYEILNRLTFKNIRFIQQDIIKVPLPEASFDAVTCISTLEHIGLRSRYGSIEDIDGDIKMMKEILKVLRPGGMVIITVPYGIAEIIAPYHRIYDYSDIKTIVAGFNIVEERYYTFDKKGDWFECNPSEGQKVKCYKDKYGLALLHLRKP